MILFASLLAAAAPPTAHHAAPIDPRSPAERYAACVKQSDTDATAAIRTATSWAAAGGGIAAAQCLGVAKSAAGDWRGAADAFIAAATIAGELKDMRTGDLWVSAGNAALAGGDAARARSALDNALAVPTLVGPMRGEALVDRARADVAAGDQPAARVDLNAALVLVPQDPVAWLLSATLARRMGDAARAATDINEAETRAPKEPAVALEAGNIAAGAGNMTAARADWTRARDADPDGDIGQEAINDLAASADGATLAAGPPAAPGKPAGR